MAKRRESHIFSLSFLDIMSCGFGAVILLFVVINNASEKTNLDQNTELREEIKKIEKEIAEEKQNLNEIQEAIQETNTKVLKTRGLTEQLREAIAITEEQMVSQSGSSQNDLEKLKEELKQLEEETALLKTSQSEDIEGGEDLYSFMGEGDRQYLTGLKVGGKHILILLDASASMLDNTIVNIIRMRNLPKEVRLQSEKWRRAVRTIEWLIANLPKQANFHLYTFNQVARAAIPEQDNKWLSVQDQNNIEKTIAHVNTIIPAGGTSLHRALAKAKLFDPPPDNIFLIVDGLPTQGFNPPQSGVVSSQERNELFADAISQAPVNTPINIILFPMEGDPLATAAYWRLAQITTGSFLSPSEDWP